MTVVDVEKLKSSLHLYLQLVEAGETVIISDHDKPVAELRPAHTVLTQPRPVGLCAGEFKVPEDFDAPLSEDILSDFEGK